MAIYEPAEDSYLLSETLKIYLKNKNKDLKILDIGSGSGIQAQTCLDLGFTDVLTADIDSEAVKLLKNKNFKSIKTNLFSNIKDKFDIIIFNPPYLPEDIQEPKDSRIATTAGKKGYEIILKFLEQAKQHINKNSIIFIVMSSLSNPKELRFQLKKSNLNYQIKQLSSKPLFFETLYIWKLELDNSKN
jgi:release factor glutamine methyltransferase